MHLQNQQTLICLQTHNSRLCVVLYLTGENWFKIVLFKVYHFSSSKRFQLTKYLIWLNLRELLCYFINKHFLSYRILPVLLYVNISLSILHFKIIKVYYTLKFVLSKKNTFTFHYFQKKSLLYITYVCSRVLEHLPLENHIRNIIMNHLRYSLEKFF